MSRVSQVNLVGTGRAYEAVATLLVRVVADMVGVKNVHERVRSVVLQLDVNFVVKRGSND